MVFSLYHREIVNVGETYFHSSAQYTCTNYGEIRGTLGLFQSFRSLEPCVFPCRLLFVPHTDLEIFQLEQSKEWKFSVMSYYLICMSNYHLKLKNR